MSTCSRDVYCDGDGTASDWYGLKNGLEASYCRHDGHEIRKTHILTICCWLAHLSNSLRFIYRNPQWLCQVNRTQRGKQRLLLFAGSNSFCLLTCSCLVFSVNYYGTFCLHFADQFLLYSSILSKNKGYI